MSSRPRGLSKSKLVSFVQCPKRLWLQTFRPELADECDAATAMRFEAGNAFGDLARSFYAGGILVDEENLAEALTRTEVELGKNVPLFEATFVHENVLVRADVLLPGQRGATLVEVKASTEVKEYQLFDAAIQAWVLAGAGQNLARVQIGHVNNQFVYPGGEQYEGILYIEDVTAEVGRIIPSIPAYVAEAKKCLALEKEPCLSAGPQCFEPYGCPFYGYCAPEREAFPVEGLPRIGKKSETLRALGYNDIRDIPDAYPLSEAQTVVREVTKRGSPMLLAGAKAEMASLPYPRAYMDFETIAFTVPIWAGTRPYQQIPFQWSCHIESRAEALTHVEFLGEDGKDPRIHFIESLLACMQNCATVIMYNAAFECTRLQELAEAFPEYASGIQDITGKVFDLLPVARRNYYHPDMMGSWSIKKVLPTIAPELDYARLAIGDGSAAQEGFLKLLALPSGSPEWQKLRTDMLLYCARDTWAMVQIGRFFEGKPLLPGICA